MPLCDAAIEEIVQQMDETTEAKGLNRIIAYYKLLQMVLALKNTIHEMEEKHTAEVEQLKVQIKE